MISTVVIFYCYESFIHITDTNPATVFWVPKSDFPYYSSSVVNVYESNKFLLRAPIPDKNAVKSGYRNGKRAIIIVAHEGRRYMLNEFEVRIKMMTLAWQNDHEPNLLEK